MPTPDPSSLLRSARRRAGLTQRELARRAGTAQSVVARIESGKAQPAAQTLARLLAAAGFEERVELCPLPVPPADLLDDVPRILRLTPEDRLRELGNADRLFAGARRV